MLARFLKNKSGATAIEYGMIGVFISIGIIVGASSLGSAVGGKFDAVATEVESNM